VIGRAGKSFAVEGTRRPAIVTPVPRGLIAAVAVSIAAHGAFMAARWPGTPSASNPAPGSTWISARLLSAVEPLQPAGDIAPALVDGGPTAPSASPQVPSVLASPDVQPVVNDPLPVASVAVPASSLPAAKPASSPSVTPSIDTEPASARSAPTAPAGASTGADRGPQLLDDIETEFAGAAGVRGGSVTLRLVISDRGVVESVEVLRSTPPGWFDAAALAILTKTRFAPAVRNGLPVRETASYEIDIAPVGRGTDASGRTY